MLTKIVMAAGNTLQHYWWALAGAVTIVVLWFRGQLRRPASRRRWDARFLRMKGAGDVIAKMETARLARTSGTLIINGVPRLSAMSVSKNVMNTTVWADIGTKIYTKVAARTT